MVCRPETDSNRLKVAQAHGIEKYVVTEANYMDPSKMNNNKTLTIMQLNEAHVTKDQDSVESHQSNEPKMLTEESKNTPARIISCLICQQKFDSNPQLKNHIQSAHIFLSQGDSRRYFLLVHVIGLTLKVRIVE